MAQLPAGISVLVPVYNSAASLPELHRRLTAVLGGLQQPYEIVLVNDGSRDGSWSAIQNLSAADAHVRGLNLMRNFGQQNALLCAVRAARYELAVTLDDDLQNPPEEIPKLLARLAEGFDVVYGAPEFEQHGLWRDVASRMTKLMLATVMGADVARDVSAFRALRVALRAAFADYRNSFVSVDALLSWATVSFGSVRVRHDPRVVGASGYTVRRLVIHAVNLITGFSVVPLQIASLAGFASTIFGMAILTYVVGRYLIQSTQVPGFAFLASLTAIQSGVQLFALGVIGEYMARMHSRIMDRPSYAVKDVSGTPGIAPPAHDDQPE